ncbi:hypothetical protein EXIGLDRAFT_842567, partial [Exidia glandulosa HHB12029]
SLALATYKPCGRFLDRLTSHLKPPAQPYSPSWTASPPSTTPLRRPRFRSTPTPPAPTTRTALSLCSLVAAV